MRGLPCGHEAQRLRIANSNLARARLQPHNICLTGAMPFKLDCLLRCSIAPAHADLAKRTTFARPTPTCCLADISGKAT